MPLLADLVTALVLTLFEPAAVSSVGEAVPLSAIAEEPVAFEFL